jgi:hypothetical protein
MGKSRLYRRDFPTYPGCFAVPTFPDGGACPLNVTLAPRGSQAQTPGAPLPARSAADQPFPFTEASAKTELAGGHETEFRRTSALPNSRPRVRLRRAAEFGNEEPRRNSPANNANGTRIGIFVALRTFAFISGHSRAKKSFREIRDPS